MCKRDIFYVNNFIGGIRWTIMTLMDWCIFIFFWVAIMCGLMSLLVAGEYIFNIY